MKSRNTVIALALLSAALLGASPAFAKDRTTGRGTGGVIYVASQGLYYDTFGTANLPPHGRFQQLHTTGAQAPYTEFGPGDIGYLGGRWWVDENGNDIMDPEDTYFLCPLLGPGRSEP
jgi:hypothetical protein